MTLPWKRLAKQLRIRATEYGRLYLDASDRAERAREDLEALEHKFSEARMDVLVAQAEAKAVRELERRTAWSNGQIADWHKLADERSAELVRVMAERDALVRLNESYIKTIGALRVAVETLLLNQDPPPLGKAATESIIAELLTRGIGVIRPATSRLGAGETHGGPLNTSAGLGLTEERKENE